MDMENLHNDERISAYLDCELSADEQARFEERLAESAELRQLVEELRALRGSLDLLPRHRLETDFAERVLRRAEQEMLISGDGESSSRPSEDLSVGHAVLAAASEGHAASAAADAPRNWKRRVVRPLVYAAAAIAAAVLIMVFNPPRDKDVAKLGDNGKPSQARPEGAVTAGSRAGAKAPNDGSGPRANPTGPSDRQISEALAERVGSSGLGGGRPEAGDSRNVRNRGDADLSKRAGTLADQSAGSPKDGEPMSKTSGLAQSGAKAGQGEVNGKLNSEDEIVKSKILSGGAAPRRLDRADHGTVVRSKDEGIEDKASSNGAARFAESPAGAPAPAGPATASNGAASGDRTAGFGAYRTELSNEGLRRNLKEAPVGMVVANCVASPEAAEQAFLNLLTKNGIAMNAAGDGQPTNFFADTLDLFIKQPAERTEEAALNRAGDHKAEGERGQGESGKDRGRPSDVAVVYVEGTPEQIQSLVGDLKAKPEVFRSLTIAAAPARSLATFGFGAGGGGYAVESAPVERRSGGTAVGGKPAENAELRASVQKRFNRDATLHDAAPPGEAPVPGPDQPQATKEAKDRLPSDSKSIDALGTKPAPAEKAVEDLKQRETDHAAAGDKPASRAGKPMTPAEYGSPKDNSAKFQSVTPPPTAGEKMPPSRPVPPAPSRSTPAAPAADADFLQAPATAPAAGAAVVGSASRSVPRPEADKKSLEWSDKQEPASNESAETKLGLGAEHARGFAVRLHVLPAESRTSQLELRKAAEQKADYAPANAPAISPVDPTDAGSVGRRRERSSAERLAATKGEDKRPAPKSELPAIQSADQPALRSGSVLSAKGADASGQAPPGRMQAIFVFRLAPAPIAAAAPVPAAQPPVAEPSGPQPPAAASPAPAAKAK